MYIQDDYDGTTSITIHSQRIGIGDTNTNSYEASDGIFIGSRDSAINMDGDTTFNLARSTDVETLTISSQTSSIDFNTAQTKVLTLVSGSDTHLTFTNQGTGQTVILKVKQPATGPGTLTLEPSAAKQPDGLHYSASQTADAIDILTLQTMENDGNVFVVSAKKFN
jgi:hypothetical protein